MEDTKKAVKIGGFLSAAQQPVTSKKNVGCKTESCSVNALPYVFEIADKKACRQAVRPPFNVTRLDAILQIAHLFGCS